jgi:signal transduction histidine kinase
MEIIKKGDDKLFLTSKLARRIFSMFLLCSILPLLIISTVSFFFVGHQLRTQSEKRLQQQCKNMGLLTYERLLDLEEELKIAARNIEMEHTLTIVQNPFNRKTREGSGLIRIFQVLPDGRKIPIVIHNERLSSSGIGQIPQLKSNQTVISFYQGKNRYPHIFMLRKILTRQHGSGVIVGEINPLYLWGIGTDGALPPEIDMSVVMNAGKLLISSIPDYHIDEGFLSASRQKSFSGIFENVQSGKTYINSYWSLFLNHHFSIPPWTFIFSQSKASIMAPVSNFMFIFFLLVLLTFWIILLLSLRTIRNRTIPVEQLKAGAMKIASGNFGHQLNISSGDEFESLAQTFNEMSTKLKQSRDMLLQAAKMSTFGQMSAGIVHEIGQPLSAISGYAELMKMGVSPEKHQKFLTMINREILRLKSIIAKFRTFAKVSKDEFYEININQVLDKTLDLMDHQLKINNVKLEYDRSASLPPIIGESDGLQQVFLNLLTNALDAMAEKQIGERTLRISSKLAEENVRVEISDSGDGISEDIQQSIFDPFFTTKGEDKGTGLGLAITSSILHKYKAEMKFTSSIGKGTVFILSFPVSNDEKRRRDYGRHTP